MDDLDGMLDDALESALSGSGSPGWGDKSKVPAVLPAAATADDGDMYGDDLDL